MPVGRFFPLHLTKVSDLHVDDSTSIGCRHRSRDPEHMTALALAMLQAQMTNPLSSRTQDVNAEVQSSYICIGSHFDPLVVEVSSDAHDDDFVHDEQSSSESSETGSKQSDTQSKKLRKRME